MYQYETIEREEPSRFPMPVMSFHASLVRDGEANQTPTNEMLFNAFTVKHRHFWSLGWFATLGDTIEIASSTSNSSSFGYQAVSSNPSIIET